MSAADSWGDYRRAITRGPAVTERKLARLIVQLCVVGALAGCKAAPARPVPHEAVVQSANGDVQCRMEAVTGSLIAKRVCLSKEQRDAIARSTQDARDAMNKALVPPDCPANGCH